MLLIARNKEVVAQSQLPHVTHERNMVTNKSKCVILVAYNSASSKHDINNRQI
jgi:hypothetical protein